MRVRDRERVMERTPDIKVEEVLPLQEPVAPASKEKDDPFGKEKKSRTKSKENK